MLLKIGKKTEKHQLFPSIHSNFIHLPVLEISVQVKNTEFFFLCYAITYLIFLHMVLVLWREILALLFLYYKGSDLAYHIKQSNKSWEQNV